MNEDKEKLLLGLNIKKLREKRGFTQERFCELINLTQPNLSNIETGKSFPAFPTFLSMLEVLQVNSNDMFEYKRMYSDIDFSDETNREFFISLMDLPQRTKKIITAIIQG